MAVGLVEMHNALVALVEPLNFPVVEYSDTAKGVTDPARTVKPEKCCVKQLADPQVRSRCRHRKVVYASAGWRLRIELCFLEQVDIKVLSDLFQTHRTVTVDKKIWFLSPSDVEIIAPGAYTEMSGTRVIMTVIATDPTEVRLT